MKRTLDPRDVAEVLSRWKHNYPLDVFPDDGESPECRAAKLARVVIDGIAADICRLLED